MKLKDKFSWVQKKKWNTCTVISPVDSGLGCLVISSQSERSKDYRRSIPVPKVSSLQIPSASDCLSGRPTLWCHCSHMSVCISGESSHLTDSELAVQAKKTLLMNPAQTLCNQHVSKQRDGETEEHKATQKELESRELRHAQRHLLVFIKS